jgi:hypothetical protein
MNVEKFSLNVCATKALFISLFYAFRCYFIITSGCDDIRIDGKIKAPEKRYIEARAMATAVNK